jgi:cobalt/nickel transport system permease protein
MYLKQDFLTRNIASLTGALESVILNEALSHLRGFLQSLDPRVKLFTLILFILTAGLANSVWILAVMLGLVIVLDLLAEIPPLFFIKRVLLFLPFTAIVALPALFITPGDSLLEIGGSTIMTAQGAHTAGLLLLRVMDSISFGLLLILSTPWTFLLRALRWFRIPALIVDILGMTYRYIFFFLHTANSTFLARRSRSLDRFSTREDLHWLTRTMTVTLIKSQHLSEEVYQAMLSRGYLGETYALNQGKIRLRDISWLVIGVSLSAALIWSNYLC